MLHLDQLFGISERFILAVELNTELCSSVNGHAWKGYSMHADSYKLIENLKDSMEFLYSEN